MMKIYSSKWYNVQGRFEWVLIRALTEEFDCTGDNWKNVYEGGNHNYYRAGYTKKYFKS